MSANKNNHKVVRIPSSEPGNEPLYLFQHLVTVCLKLDINKSPIVFELIDCEFRMMYKHNFYVET